MTKIGDKLTLSEETTRKVEELFARVDAYQSEISRLAVLAREAGIKAWRIVVEEVDCDLVTRDYVYSWKDRCIVDAGPKAQFQESWREGLDARADAAHRAASVRGGDDDE